MKLLGLLVCLAFNIAIMFIGFNKIDDIVCKHCKSFFKLYLFVSSRSGEGVPVWLIALLIMLIVYAKLAIQYARHVYIVGSLPDFKKKTSFHAERPMHIAEFFLVGLGVNAIFWLIYSIYRAAILSR